MIESLYLIYPSPKGCLRLVYRFLVKCLHGKFLIIISPSGVYHLCERSLAYYLQVSVKLSVVTQGASAFEFFKPSVELLFGACVKYKELFIMSEHEAESLMVML